MLGRRLLGEGSIGDQAVGNSSMTVRPAGSDVTPDAMDQRRRFAGRWNVVVMSVIVGCCVVAGVAAALAGGWLTRLGEGFGGLYGIPALVMVLVAVAVAISAAMGLVRRAGRFRGALRDAVVIVAGAWIVAIGYVQVAHSVDPCANGWWDANSRIGGQHLCERFDAELNWHTRFHLLAHAAPAAGLLAIYAWAVRRWAPPVTDPPGAQPADPPAGVPA